MKKIANFLMKLSWIGSNDVLENGTYVSVGNKIGQIVGHKINKDQFGKSVTVHKVKFFATDGRKGPKTTKNPFGIYYKKLDKTMEVNYSFLQVMDKDKAEIIKKSL
jgi:hypothetical protein